MAVFRRAETLLAILLFAQSALSLICYKTQPDTSIAASDCGNSLLLCASYLSGVATTLSYGCLGSSSCNPPLYNDLTCCSTSYCNAPPSTTSTSAPPIASNFPNGRAYIPYASTWAYLDSASPSNWALLSFNDSAWLRSSAPFGFTSTGLANNMQTLLSVSNSGASYFRYTFSLDPAYFNALEKAEARVWFQDGVVIYLNGVVLNSFNMPSSVSFTTAASSITNTVITYPFLPTELTNSTNVIAVEIHQAANSTAKFFDFELILVATTDNPYPFNNAAIRKGDTWLYSTTPPVSSCDWSVSGLVSGSSCGTASGSAPIGYNDSNLATQIQTSATTLYVSKSFTAPSIVGTAYMSISYDGGFVVYLTSLQGITEAFRVNMPNGQVNYTTLAVADTPPSRRQTYYTFNLGSFVIPNTNYINIELHAFNQSNPHFSFDAELIVVSAATTCTPFDTNPTTSPINSYPYNYNYTQCVFPFLFNGKSYSSCTTITDGGRSGESWCGLTSNVDIDNLWGYCNPCVSSCASTCIPPSINNEYEYSWCASSGGYCDIVSPTSSTPTSTATVTATPSQTSTVVASALIGEIVGGVVGGLVVIAVVLIFLLLFSRRNRSKPQPSSPEEPQKQAQHNTLLANSSTNLSQSFYRQTQSQMSMSSLTNLSNRSPGDTRATNMSVQSLSGHTKSSSTSPRSTANNGAIIVLPDQRNRIFASDQGTRVSAPGPSTEATLINTQIEKALPGFLMLTDLKQQIRLGRVINQGGSGTLYEGHVVDPELQKRVGNEKVAVKMVKYPNHTEEQALAAFHHEITAMWSLSFDPNCLSLLAYDDTTTTMVIPLYDGDLDFFLHKAPERLLLDDGTCLHLILCIAQGMNAIHSTGIVHRDLKCANVLLRSTGAPLPEVVIADFGISRIAENHEVASQGKFELFGLSPRYAAPEAFARYYMSNLDEQSSDVQKKSDVFSFSVMVWEIITRKVPWDGYSAADIEMKVRSGEQLPSPTANTLIQQALVGLWKWCGNFDASHRPTFAVVTQALVKVANEWNEKVSRLTGQQ